MEQLGQVLSPMMETMRGMQLQQVQLQQALQTSDKTVSGITLQPCDENNESLSSYLQRLQYYITLKGVTNATTKMTMLRILIFNQTIISSDSEDDVQPVVNTAQFHISPRPSFVESQSYITLSHPLMLEHKYSVI
ncbi:unnamed protein product [Euphydryas editha]|uniref:Uncharacterized protein n=1 Tax=Euphydryas editha TaxID=104508 RepID=A0AAU9TRX5_EUPED|nr:unnamed protein product [Euphydryas editha]